MNQIHSREQESPFYAEWHDGGSGINSSPISFVDSDHSRNDLVDLIMPSSKTRILFGSGTLSMSYSEGMDVLEYRKKEIYFVDGSTANP